MNESASQAVETIKTAANGVVATAISGGGVALWMGILQSVLSVVSIIAGLVLTFYLIRNQKIRNMREKLELEKAQQK
jgi:hypothetical protein